jgi:hypothetical protein
MCCVDERADVTISLDSYGLAVATCSSYTGKESRNSVLTKADFFMKRLKDIMMKSVKDVSPHDPLG